MARSDKKNRTCERCGKECANPNKLREHLNRKFKCKPIPIQTPAPQVKDQGGPQNKNQKNDPEAGPGPSTQAYRKGKPIEVERQDAQIYCPRVYTTT